MNVSTRPIRVMLLGAAALALIATRSAASDEADAGGLRNCDVPADAMTADAEELEMVRLVNQYRVANGQRELTLSTNLMRSAAWMASDMAKNNYFGHSDSGGRDTFTRTVDCGYPVIGGENLAAGTSKDLGQEGFDMLRASPAHNENMLTDYYYQIGVARVYDPDSRYKWYWVQTFGTVDDGTAGHVGGSPMQVQAAAGASAPAVVKPPTIDYGPGSHFVTWSGPSVTISELQSVSGGLQMVYAFDATSRTWKRWSAGFPPYANSLATIEPGAAYWFVSDIGFTLPSY